MKILKQLDDAILKRTQDAYLWLFDRTGAYAGTVAIIIFIMSYALQYAGRETSKLALFALAANGANCIFRCVLQNRGNETVYNAMVRAWSSSLFRYLIYGMYLGILIVNIVAVDIRGMFSGFLDVLFFNFALCWQVRKREPPEKLVMAIQRT